MFIEILHTSNAAMSFMKRTIFPAAMTTLGTPATHSSALFIMVSSMLAIILKQTVGAPIVKLVTFT